MWYSFQVYNIVIWHFCILLSALQDKDTVYPLGKLYIIVFYSLGHTDYSYLKIFINNLSTSSFMDLFILSFFLGVFGNLRVNARHCVVKVVLYALPSSRKALSCLWYFTRYRQITLIQSSAWSVPKWIEVYEELRLFIHSYF